MYVLKGVKDQLVCKVKVELPADMGRKTTVVFNATFKKLKLDELKALAERIANADITDRQLIDEFMVTWSDLKGANDDLIPFCSEAVDEVMGAKEYSDALVHTFMREIMGIDVDKLTAAHVKNS